MIADAFRRVPSVRDDAARHQPDRPQPMPAEAGARMQHSRYCGGMSTQAGVSILDRLGGSRRDIEYIGEPSAPEESTAPSTLVFSTQTLPTAHQADAWRAGNAPSLDVIFNEGTLGFAAEREVISFGPFVMTRVVADSATAIRTRNHVRRDGLDHWCLNLTVRGDRRFRWDRGDRCLSVPAGQLHVQALDEAYWGFREQTEWIGVFFTRDSLPGLSVHLDATRDHPRADARSRMLAEYLAALWPVLPALALQERARVAEATAAMITACVCGTSDALGGAQPYLQAHQRARALTVIRRNLGSPRLTPQSVGRALGVSRSQLYRAFEPVGGVASAIQEERLKAVGRLLLQPDEARSIVKIGEAVGFFDPSSFSRQFRRSFGVTPTEWRRAPRGGRGVDDRKKAGGFGLADFLRG
ncbi:AraC family transcriptional regulator [Roseomonas sp. CAU 1739]|uniref:AraC family transcriptional regulator n=1 Tax=Roseomonas sp. CAU 1739 TaxID=3140364 RepID=UPI00325BBE0D